MDVKNIKIILREWAYWLLKTFYCALYCEKAMPFFKFQDFITHLHKNAFNILIVKICPAVNKLGSSKKIPHLLICDVESEKGHDVGNFRFWVIDIFWFCIKFLPFWCKLHVSTIFFDKVMKLWSFRYKNHHFEKNLFKSLNKHKIYIFRI
jgi:hypothetical protein